MEKSNRWGHTKLSLETQSKSERRKGLKEIDKQQEKFKKLVDQLRRNAHREKTDEESK